MGWEMVGEEGVFVVILGGERLQVVCEEPRRDGLCVWGGRKVHTFIIMLMQVIRTVTVTITV